MSQSAKRPQPLHHSTIPGATPNAAQPHRTGRNQGEPSFGPSKAIKQDREAASLQPWQPAAQPQGSGAARAGGCSLPALLLPQVSPQPTPELGAWCGGRAQPQLFALSRVSHKVQLVFWTSFGPWVNQLQEKGVEAIRRRVEIMLWSQ